jgi:acyl-coenzyme A thioesterase 13
MKKSSPERERRAEAPPAPSAAKSRRAPKLGPPPGWSKPVHSSAFREYAGPIYIRRAAGGTLFGLRVQAKHGNRVGGLHGGVLATLADMAMGYSCCFTRQPPLRMVTVSLSVDYAGSADEGDWIEARVDVQKVGRRVAFANCFVWRGEERIARASGSYLVLEAPRSTASKRSEGSAQRTVR